jgi:pimeloyl-ACP methyl ester carboxylesterase
MTPDLPTGAVDHFDVAETTPTHFVTTEAARFAYRTLGSGSPLVLLQRFRGTLDDWDPALLNLLASERQVIIFDNAGIGSSSGSTPATIGAMAADAAHFLRALSLSQVDVLGWSMGGMVAQSLALQEPDLVRRLILAGTAGPDIPGTLRLSSDVLKVAAKPANTSDDLLYLFFPETPEGRAAGAASLGRIAQRQGPADPLVAQPSWVTQLTASGAFITGQEIAYTQLAQLYQPTLVANGDSDIMLPPVDSELLAELLPNAELALYPGAGHGFLFQRHAEFGRRALEFLQR